jgi:hypothetical protein
MHDLLTLKVALYDENCLSHAEFFKLMIQSRAHAKENDRDDY